MNHRPSLIFSNRRWWAQARWRRPSGSRTFALIVFLVFAFLVPLCPSQELTVAAAADLQFVLQDVAVRFQKESGTKVKLVYGSSGNFFQQIENGAPIDMFFSANLDYPKRLEAEGLIQPGTYYEYARGKLVIWVPKDSQLNLDSGVRSLLDPSVRKVAIANPAHAPYGQAAVAALKGERVYDKVKEKLVLGENASQAASFAASGAADVGVVPMSLALSPNMKDKGRYVEVPAADYPAIEQACVILAGSKNKQAARQFMSLIKTSATAELLRSYGFDVPGGAIK
jgi:molybdate transport system substrate-binding protein